MIFKQSYLDELRNPNNYLSDIIIEFYFNYLSSIHPSDSILFVPPTISFFIANSVDPAAIKECLKSLELTVKRLVIFPVNNGGIHWSLLVYYRDLDYFIHHDSMKGLNHWEASRLYRAVKEHVRPTSRKRRFYPDEDPVFRPGLTPQQTNGYDCGLYVMAIAKVICQWYCNDDPEKKVTWIQEVEENVDVTLEFTLRPHVLELIEEASCGRLGSVSCAIEAPKHATEPKEEEGAGDRGPPKEDGASDRGTPKEDGDSDRGTPKEEGANDRGTLKEEGVNDCGMPEEDVPDDDEGCPNDCGTSTVPALPLIDQSV